MNPTEAHNSLTRGLVRATAAVDLDAARSDERDTILDRAHELSLFPLVYKLLEVQDLLDRASSRQRRHWVAHRVRHRVLLEHTQRVCEALAEIDFLILKGLSLGVRLYGASEWRSTGDIDVLVCLGDLDAAVEALAKIGFRPKGDARPEPWVNNEYQLFHVELGLVVELHWALTLPKVPSPSFDELFAARTMVMLRDELEVPVLGNEHGFLQACYHFHHHVGFLKGLLDIAGWLDRYGEELDFGAIDEMVCRLGVEGVVQWPLHSIAKLTGLEVPGLKTNPRWAVELWSRFTCRATRGALSSEESVRGYSALAFKTQDVLKGHVMAWGMLASLLLDRPGARLKGVWQPVFLGPEAMAQKLGKEEPDVEAWARVAGRPVELVWKQLREVLGR
jgi:hypothetical protein